MLNLTFVEKQKIFFPFLKYFKVFLTVNKFVFIKEALSYDNASFFLCFTKIIIPIFIATKQFFTACLGLKHINFKVYFNGYILYLAKLIVYNNLCVLIKITECNQCTLEAIPALLSLLFCICLIISNTATKTIKAKARVIQAFLKNKPPAI